MLREEREETGRNEILGQVACCILDRIIAVCLLHGLTLS